jgi:multidrug efflux system membrane fusion protein
VTRTFAVRVSVPDADAALQLGRTVNVGVQGRARADGALLPLTALYRDGERPAVWIYDPAAQTVRLQPVQVVQYREDGVLIGDGVTSGQWVVTAGVHKLQPGQKVRPYEADAAASSDTAGTSGVAPAARRG